MRYGVWGDARSGIGTASEHAWKPVVEGEGLNSEGLYSGWRASPTDQAVPSVAIPPREVFPARPSDVPALGPSLEARAFILTTAIGLDRHWLDPSRVHGSPAGERIRTRACSVYCTLGTAVDEIVCRHRGTEELGCFQRTRSPLLSICGGQSRPSRPLRSQTCSTSRAASFCGRPDRPDGRRAAEARLLPPPFKASRTGLTRSRRVTKSQASGDLPAHPRPLKGGFPAMIPAQAASSVKPAWGNAPASTK